MFVYQANCGANYKINSFANCGIFMSGFGVLGVGK